MSKILITGGTGFMGFHLASNLANEGHDVDIIDNFSRGVIDHDFKQLLNLPNVKIIQSDLRLPSAFDECALDYNLIFNFAALLGVENVLKQPLNVLSDNVKICFNVLDFSKRLSKLERLIYPSTSEVYAGTLQHYDLIIPTPETTPLAIPNLDQPRTSYMLSKIYGEALCWHSEIPFTIIRPHNIYGPRMGMSHVIPELLKKAHEAPSGGTIEVASVNHTRTFCFIDDAIEQLKRISQSTECLNTVLNLGNQKPEISIRDLSAIIIDTVGNSLNIIEASDTSGSVSRRCPDMTKMTNKIKYSAKCDLQTGISKTYAWYSDKFF